LFWEYIYLKTVKGGKEYANRSGEKPENPVGSSALFYGRAPKNRNAEKKKEKISQ
jgi:hypothetical protein